MIRSIWHQGRFVGFSALIGGELTTPTSYKRLMLALADAGCDPIYIQPTMPTQRHSGFGEL